MKYMKDNFKQKNKSLVIFKLMNFIKNRPLYKLFIWKIIIYKGGRVNNLINNVNNIFNKYKFKIFINPSTINICKSNNKRNVKLLN